MIIRRGLSLLRVSLALSLTALLLYALIYGIPIAPPLQIFATEHRTVAVVAAITQDVDSNWIQAKFPHFQRYLYSVDDPAAPLTTRDKGHEGSAYLTYLIDNYERLADYVIFIHGARYQWHNDDRMYDGAEVLKRLKFKAVDRYGYVNLRCVLTPGCDNKITIRPKLEWDREAQPGGIGWTTLLGRSFAEVFPDEPLPHVISTPCCAQFVVSKAQLLRKSRGDYLRYRQFLWDWSYHKYMPEVRDEILSPVNISDPNVQSGLAGEMLENFWHIIFGNPPAHCVPIQQCYCEVYDICDALCEDDTICRDRYFFPPSNKMPQGWPEVGQGAQGWPVDGWWL